MTAVAGGATEVNVSRITNADINVSLKTPISEWESDPPMMAWSNATDCRLPPTHSPNY